MTHVPDGHGLSCPECGRAATSSTRVDEGVWERECIGGHEWTWTNDDVVAPGGDD